VVTTEPVTIEQAAALLNVSASTIRRRIRAGSLQVTETRRPQGVVWLVHLPPGVRLASETATVDTAPVDTAPTALPAQPSQAEAMTAMIQATLTPIIAPLVGELAASRQTHERQAEQLVSQAETIGTLRAERDTGRAEVETLKASWPATGQEAPQPVEPTADTRMTRLRALAPWLLLVVILIVAAVVGWSG
jgi:excisionase family DNA binding protein